MREQRTEERYICSECGHSAENHERANRAEKPRVGHCCLGGCPCGLTGSQVRDREAPQERPVFAGYSRSSGKWGVF